jgi:phosphohistidine swiveling domain-containing protein
VRRMLSFFLPVMVNTLHTMLQPNQARERFDALLEAYLQTVKIDRGTNPREHLANLATFMGNQGGLADALPTLVPHFIQIMAPAIASLNLIEHLLPKKDDSGNDFSNLALEVTRGLPHNVTIEMDLALWETATIIHHDDASAATFNNNDIPTLVSLYRTRTLPEAGQAAVERFMEKYGMRGVGEIDLGQPRWRENPTSIMQTLQGYLKIKPEFAPDLLYEKGAQAAEETIEFLAAEARRQRGGIVKEKLVRGAARRVRLLMGARESPKFFAVCAMGIVRKHILEVGDEFYAAGTISQADDLFYLHVAELEKLSRQEGGDWKAIVSGRRKAYERELRRRQVPRVLVSDGRTFYGGIGAGIDTSDNLTGSPVSPGMVEGIVHVVLDPYDANLSPGEILVCPGTDPAWTPLFMAAGGLVMEVGGMMTHGSVVAREYGIPAVVGVNQATVLLKTGQRIRVDGTTGKIAIL